MAARLTAYVVVGIVAATLIAGLIVGAQRDDIDGPVDIIVHNAKVYTAGANGSMAEAVAIRGNQILRVGSERDVMRLVAAGLSNQAVGEALFISDDTVKSHLRRIFERLGVTSRTQAIHKAQQLGLI